MRQIVRDVKAISPVIGTILVVFIILSATSTVLIWGIPYIDGLKAKSEQENVAAQFTILDGALNDMINSGLGSQRENRITIEEGTFSVEKNEERAIISYSLKPGYDFNLTDLDNTDPLYDPYHFDLHMEEGSADLVKISWLTTQTPYSGFEEINIPNGDEPGGIAELYSVYKFYDTPEKCVAYYDLENLTPPHAPDSFPNNMYSIDQANKASVDQIGIGSSYENEWYGIDSHSADKYANLLYQYNITESIYNITRLNFTWKGFDTFTNGGSLRIFIWNFTSNAWETILVNTTTKDINFIYSLDENLSNYISNDELYIAVSGGRGGFENSLPTYSSPSPHNVGGIHTDAPLSVYVEDTDEPTDTLTVKFYNASDDTLLHTETVAGSGTPSFTWAGLSLSKTYYWYVEIFDGHEYVSNKDSPWYFTTRSNVAPEIIIDSDSPEPSDGAINIDGDGYVNLSVDVVDSDGDSLRVTFYDYDLGFQIDFPQTVEGGSGRATIDWYLGDRGVTHQWYVVVEDDWVNATSPIWDFTTKPNTVPVASCKSPVTGGNPCQPITFSWTFSDADGDTQRAFQVQVKESANTWSELVVTSGQVYSSVNRWTCILFLGELVSHDWRVRLYDGYDWSSWDEVTGFYPSLPCPPVKCFAKGTLVTLANDKEKPIEQVQLGDFVKSYDFKTRSIVTSKVVSKVEPYHKYYSINDGVIKITADHPLYIKKTNGLIGWGAIDPDFSKYSYELNSVYKIEIGDKFLSINGEWGEPVYSIDFVDEYVQTYSLGLEGINNFYANGILAYGLEKNTEHTLHEQYVELKVFHTMEDYGNPWITFTETDQGHTFPPNYLELNQDDITIYWEGHDDITDSFELEYQWRLNPNGDWSEFSKDASVSLNIPSAGLYSLNVRARDLAGNIESIKSTNTLSIRKLVCNKEIPVTINEGDYETINAESDCNTNGISDFIKIDICRNNETIGRAYILDFDSLIHSLSTSSDYYKTIFLNGAVVCQKSNHYSFYNNPSFLDNFNILTFRFMHTKAVNDFSIGKGGRFSVLSRVISNDFIESDDVYMIKASFYGDTSPIWIKHMHNNYDFQATSDPNTIYYSTPVRLILSHSIVELKMQL